MNRVLFAVILAVGLAFGSQSQAQVRVLDQAEAKTIVTHAKKVLQTLKSKQASIEVQGRKLTKKEQAEVAELSMRVRVLNDAIKLLDPYIAGKKLEYNQQNSTLVIAAEKIIERFGDGTMKRRASRITPGEIEIAAQAKLDREEAKKAKRERTRLVAEMNELKNMVAELKEEIKRANIEAAVLAIEARVAEAQSEHDKICAEIEVNRAKLHDIATARKMRELAAKRTEKKPAKQSGKAKKKGSKKKAKRIAKAKPLHPAEAAREQAIISQLHFELAKLEQRRAAWRVKLLNSKVRLAEMRTHLMRSKLKKFNK